MPRPIYSEAGVSDRRSSDLVEVRKARPDLSRRRGNDRRPSRELFGTRGERLLGMQNTPDISGHTEDR